MKALNNTRVNVANIPHMWSKKILLLLFKEYRNLVEDNSYIPYWFDCYNYHSNNYDTKAIFNYLKINCNNFMNYYYPIYSAVLKKSSLVSYVYNDFFIWYCGFGYTCVFEEDNIGSLFNSKELINIEMLRTIAKNDHMLGEDFIYYMFHYSMSHLFFNGLYCLEGTVLLTQGFCRIISAPMESFSNPCQLFQKLIFCENWSINFSHIDKEVFDDFRHFFFKCYKTDSFLEKWNLKQFNILFLKVLDCLEDFGFGIWRQSIRDCDAPGLVDFPWEIGFTIDRFECREYVYEHLCNYNDKTYHYNYKTLSEDRKKDFPIFFRDLEEVYRECVLTGVPYPANKRRLDDIDVWLNKIKSI